MCVESDAQYAMFNHTAVLKSTDDPSESQPSTRGDLMGGGLSRSTGRREVSTLYLSAAV